MKLGGIFVLVLGMALFPTCTAEVGPNDLWQFNSPMHFTTGVEVDKGITSTPGIVDRQPCFSADQVKFTCLNAPSVEFLYLTGHHIDHARLDPPSF